MRRLPSPVSGDDGTQAAITMISDVMAFLLSAAVKYRQSGRVRRADVSARPATSALGSPRELTHEPSAHPRRNQGQGRHHPPQSAAGAQCAQCGADRRARRRDRHLRGRSEYRLHRHHRLRQGLRGRRRHQGDGGQSPTWTPSWATSPPTGTGSRARPQAGRSRRSPASRSAAAASSPCSATSSSRPTTRSSASPRSSSA